MVSVLFSRLLWWSYNISTPEYLTSYSINTLWMDCLTARDPTHSRRSRSGLVSESLGSRFCSPRFANFPLPTQTHTCYFCAHLHSPGLSLLCIPIVFCHPKESTAINERTWRFFLCAGTDQGPLKKLQTGSAQASLELYFSALSPRGHRSGDCHNIRRRKSKSEKS